MKPDELILRCIDLVEVIKETQEDTRDNYYKDADNERTAARVRVLMGKYAEESIKIVIAEKILGCLHTILGLDQCFFNMKASEGKAGMIMPMPDVVNSDIQKYSSGGNPGLSRLQAAAMPLWLMGRIRENFENTDKIHKEAILSEVDTCLLGIDTLSKCGLYSVLDDFLKTVKKHVKEYRQYADENY